VGISFSGSRPSGGRLIAAATTEGGVTLAIVALGMLLIIPVGLDGEPLPYAMLAAILGICAVASAAGSLQPGGHAHSPSERIGDFDAVIMIVLGGAAMGLLREAAPGAALLLVLQSAGVALVIAIGAWLLLSESGSLAEQRVFTGALLLLLGGAACERRQRRLAPGWPRESPETSHRASWGSACCHRGSRGSLSR
jgi:hypothetical protein